MMKKHYLIVFNFILIIISIVLSIFTLSSFAHISTLYIDNHIQYKLAMMNTIWFFFILFFILTFLIDYKLYIIICTFILLIGLPTWIYIYYIELNHGEIFFLDLETIQDMTSIVSFSILSPGLTLIVILFIKRNTSKFDENKILGKYHMHEGFLGIMLVISALILWFIRILLVQIEIFTTKLRIFLALDMILLFVVLYFGSFLLFRDWRDVLHLKFFEKSDDTKNINEIEMDFRGNSTVFSQITPESILFFKKLKVIIYPIGVLLASFSANALIHGKDLLPRELFNLELENIVLIGIACDFIGAGMIGLDWYRLFAKTYPDKYEEIKRVLKNFKE